MTKKSQAVKPRKVDHQNANECSTHGCVDPESAASVRDKGTPIETYKGDPSATRSKQIGDLEEETLEQNAPFNKTYGIKKG